MASKVTLRVRCEGGQEVVKGLVTEDSLEKLISHSLEALGMEEARTENLKILSGFPPKPLDISDRDKSISSVGIRTGDTIIFQVSQSSSNPADVRRSEPKQALSHDGESGHKRLKTNNQSAPNSQNFKLKRKVVPADNSCLFTSINYCMTGTLVGSEHSAFMREVIASVLNSDQEKYCEAFLGRSNPDYTRWIQTKDAWGGAIEVQILAEYFQVEIVVVDTKTGSFTRFGESLDLPTRMVLIYDGIHYDALYNVGPDGVEATVHPITDLRILDMAKATAKEAKEAHNYTDTAGFTLKCLICGTRLKGETEAQKHAKTTTHTNFSEV